MSAESKATYLVATVKPWNVEAFARRTRDMPGEWHLFQSAQELTLETVRKIAPRYVFFPHWSWKVPLEITDRYECVCFHMADVPYGRGGSPLQNLILRGHAHTMLSALRMVEELDAGPVYLKKPLSLAGSAQEIFVRTADLAYDLMQDIVTREPVPVPQTGTPVLFERRRPEQSQLPSAGSAADLHDFVRMLDAETYPRAYLDHGAFRLEFSNARRDGDEVVAEVRIANRTNLP
jgi:methionyl-tRNA formyltransferase